MAGLVHFGDLVEGVSVQDKVDEVTGLSRKVVIESRDKELRPHISLEGPEAGLIKKLPGSELDATYFLPVGANIESGLEQAQGIL